MSVEYPSCRIDHLSGAYDLVERHKKKFDPDKQDEALQRAAQFEARMRSSGKLFSNAEAMAQANKVDNRLMMDRVITEKLGTANELNPSNRYKIQNFLENWMGIQITKLGSGGELTELGGVRQRLLEARRLGQNYVELLVEYTRNDAISSLQKKVYSIGKKYGMSKKDMNKILVKAREVGGITQQKVARNIGDAGYAILEQEYNKFLNQLTNLGFNADEIEDILDSANRIYARMDAVRATAQAMGVDIGNIEGIGYIPRMFQPDAMKFIKGQEQQDVASALMQKFKDDPNPLMISYHFQKSRNTYKYIPEDDFLVSAFVGVEPDAMRQMVLDGTFQNFLHKNVPAERIEELIDTGLMSKIPMFTDDMAKYVISQYGEMPFKELDELLITDPERLYSAYKDALQRAAGDSVMMKTMITDGVVHGWAATPDMLKLEPKEYKGWESLPETQIKKYYDAWTGGDMYVHPDVAATFRAIDDLIQSPEKLSTIANVFRNLGGLWIQSALISMGYIQRNLWTNIVALHANGGNLLRIWEGYRDVSRVLAEGVSALDDTQAVYKMGDKLVTKRKFFEEFFLHNGNSFVPQSSFLKAKNVQLGDPLRGLGYLINYSKAHGVIRPAKAGDTWFEGVRYALEQLKDVQDVPMSYLARISQFNEMSTKWTAMISRADTRPGNTVGQFLGATKGTALDNWQDELRAVDNLFFMWDDVGKIPSFVGRHVMPFATVMMKMPPAVIRHAMTNPKKFVNYWRVRQFINQNAENDDDYIDAGVADWKSDAGLLNLWKDPESKNWVGIMTNSYDPIAGSVDWFEKIARNVGAASGVITGSTETQTRMIKEKYNWKTFAAEFFRDAPPINKMAVEFITGMDLREGKKKEESFIKESPTFMGLRWYSPNPAINAGLQAVKGILSAYPPTGALDRANFGGVLGVPTVPDPRNPFTPLVEGRPSVFGASRTEGSLERYYPEMRTVAAMTTMYLGLNPTVIDQAKQAQVNEAFMKSTLGDIRRDIRTVSNKMYRGDIKDRAELDNLYKQIRYAREVELKLDIAILRLQLWMQQQGVPTKDVWNRMRSLGVNELPPLAEKDSIEMQIKYAEQLAEDDAAYNEIIQKRGLK